MRILSIFTVVGVVTALTTGCKEPVNTGSVLDLTVEQKEAGTAVECDTVCDVAFKFGDLDLYTTEVAKAYRTDSDAVYLSIRVFALKDYPSVNNMMVSYVDSVYNYVTMQNVKVGEAASIPDVVSAFDELGRNFTDSVAPSVYDRVPGYNLTIDIRPVYATDKYVTYATFLYAFAGGANGESDYYYTTFDLVTAEEYGFDRMVKSGCRSEVRKALVHTIASSQDMSTDNYLKQINEFLMLSGADALTTENFPIYHVGLSAEGLLFCYPQYSIAPGSSSNSVYLLPMSSVEDCLSI